MKKTGIVVLVFSMLTGCRGLLGEDRAVQAFDEKIDQVKAMLSEQGIAFDSSFQVFFRAFKTEKLLELWACEAAGKPFVLLKTYDVCRASGGLGPKRKAGDRQVPEGFYTINRFNPKSRFHLSLGLNYPNEADLVLADRKRPGSDIFIHGGCESIGCLAMTDDVIKEIYVIASEAASRGQCSIGVHIFPQKMSDGNFEQLIEKHPEWGAFWRELKQGFDFFEKTKTLPVLTILESGAYRFSM